METPIEYLILKEEQVNCKTMNDVFEYEVLVRRPPEKSYHNKYDIAFTGKFHKDQYEEFAETADSMIGFYICINYYYFSSSLYFRKFILSRGIPKYTNYSSYRYCDNNEVLYELSPVVVIYHSPRFKPKSQYFPTKYLQLWPSLLLIYCLEKKANHKIIF
jgi:hypothetical protein